MSDRLAALAKQLGHDFTNPRLLDQALTHRSAGTPNNERLEFLGDSLLNCMVAAMLYEQLPDWPEGDLSRLRSTLVNQPSLVMLADSLSLGQHLRLGDGELKSGGHRRPSILADSMEAIIGAVFLDSGFSAASAVVKRLYGDRLAAPATLQPTKDPKTSLQELLQGRRLPLPSYRVVETRGDAHDQTFHISCHVEALRLTTEGVGPSRRAAEQVAAAAMITLIPPPLRHRRPASESTS
jgi:ribonuclease III